MVPQRYPQTLRAVQGRNASNVSSKDVNKWPLFEYNRRPGVSYSLGKSGHNGSTRLSSSWNMLKQSRRRCQNSFSVPEPCYSVSARLRERWTSQILGFFKAGFGSSPNPPMASTLSFFHFKTHIRSTRSPTAGPRCCAWPANMLFGSLPQQQHPEAALHLQQHSRPV